MTPKDFTLYIHIGSLAYAVFGILYADRVGFSWIRGQTQTLRTEQLRRAHDTVSMALGSLIASGFYLMWPMRNYLLGQPSFYIKMCFVITLIINSYAIGALMQTSTKRAFSELTSLEKVPFFISGAVSMLCWAGAAVTAFFLF